MGVGLVRAWLRDGLWIMESSARRKTRGGAAAGGGVPFLTCGTVFRLEQSIEVSANGGARMTHHLESRSQVALFTWECLGGGRKPLRQRSSTLFALSVYTYTVPLSFLSASPGNGRVPGAFRALRRGVAQRGSVRLTGLITKMRSDDVEGEAAWIWVRIKS